MEPTSSITSLSQPIGSYSQSIDINERIGRNASPTFECDLVEGLSAIAYGPSAASRLVISDNGMLGLQCADVDQERLEALVIVLRPTYEESHVCKAIHYLNEAKIPLCAFVGTEGECYEEFAKQLQITREAQDPELLSCDLRGIEAQAQAEILIKVAEDFPEVCCLSIDSPYIDKIPPALERGLTSFTASGCHSLRELFLPNAKELYLRDCPNLETIDAENVVSMSQVDGSPPALRSSGERETPADTGPTPDPLMRSCNRF